MSYRNVYSTCFLNGTGAGEYVITGAEGFASLISCIDGHVGATTGGTFRIIGPAGQVLYAQQYGPVNAANFNYRGKIVLQPGDSLTLVCDALESGFDEFDITASGDALTLP